jgi:hypothetical protein
MRIIFTAESALHIDMRASAHLKTYWAMAI